MQANTVYTDSGRSCYQSAALVFTIGPPLSFKRIGGGPVQKAAQAKSLAKTILVVDDEPQMLNIVSEFLCGQYHIITANNGMTALQRAREYKGEIDVLLSDFQMEGMMGSELATRITLARPRIKVLLMSSYSEGTLALNEGWHFLPKPFSLSHLRTLVRSLAYPGTAREEPLRTTQREQVGAG